MAKRIVVINDDTTFLALMQELLRDAGYHAEICKEGAASHHVVRALDPDLIVLDIRLDNPEAGWLVLELFKLDRALSNKPVIVCVSDFHFGAERLSRLEEKGYNLLYKPFDPDDLLELVKQLIGPPDAKAVGAQ